MRAALLGIVLAFVTTAAFLLGLRPGVAAPAAAAAWEPAKTWVLMIGILEWEKPGLGHFPKEGRFDRLLEKTLVSRGVPAAQITFVKDTQATLDVCRTALAKVAGAGGPGSTLLVYYAGHGLLEDERFYFTPYDTDPEDAAGTGLAVGEIADTLKRTWKGSRLLLLADCCYSGALGSVVRGYDDDSVVKAASLTSALASNLSTGNWTYTEAVVAALSGDGLLDRDDDGAVSFDEADAHVRRQMRFREAQLAEASRTPSFEAGFVLSKVDPARRRAKVAGPWQVGDYVETRWKDKWWRSQVLEAESGRAMVRYLGWDASSDEWVEAARVRAPRPLAATAGDRVEVEWKGKWWPALVKEVREDFAFIHYDDYRAEWDEWVGARRLRPPTAK